jgi:ABC-2 type transport system ATP-binding protein
VSRPAIGLERLDVTRGGAQVLAGLSLEVSSGAVTGLLGPSGCGKTTLMRAIVGVQDGVRGELTVLGLPAGDARLRTRVGYVTQAPSVYGDLDLEENMAYFASISGISRERVAEVLRTVGLAGRERQLVGSMSGGEQTRVSLATALLPEPEVLILDEPTVGLDPILRAELWRSFRDLAQRGTTLLVSSHVMEEAAECDALLLMRDGKLLAQTTPEGLRGQTGERDLGRAFLAVIKRTGVVPSA